MYFNNPDIIRSEVDVVLGSVRSSEDNLNYLNLINRIQSVIAYHIHKDIELLVSPPDITHRKALNIIANKVFDTLDVYYRANPKDEEDLAELVMQSRNFEMWSSDIKNRFMAIHTDKITLETKIPSFVSSKNSFTQEQINEILDEVNLDTILMKLSSYKDIGNQSNYF